MTGFSSFNIFLQILINGILFGGMYGVAAIGLSLIFGSLQIIFIAQGTMMILAAYFTYWAFTLTSIDPFFCFLLILPIFLGIGWAFYVGLFHKVAAAGKNPSLLLAFGLMILLENLMSVAFTPNTRAVTTRYPDLLYAACGLFDQSCSNGISLSIHEENHVGEGGPRRVGGHEGGFPIGHKPP